MFQRNIEVVNPADFIAPLEEGTPADDLHPVARSPATPPDQVQKLAAKNTLAKALHRNPRNEV